MINTLPFDELIKKCADKYEIRGKDLEDLFKWVHNVIETVAKTNFLSDEFGFLAAFEEGTIEVVGMVNGEPLWKNRT